MADQEQHQTTAEAINSITAEDLDSAVDEAAADASDEEGVEESASAEGEGEGEAEGEAEASAEGDEGEGAEGDEDEDEDEDGLQLTPEQLAAIKANPEMRQLYRSLMRATTKKWQAASDAVRLTEAYRRDPVGVLQAIARANGFAITRPDAQPQVDPNQQAIQQAHGKLVEMFGDQVGPEVFKTLATMVQAVTGSQVAPLRDTLGRVVNQGEAQRMMGEEHSFRAAHPDMTPAEERAVVELGNRGDFVPGPQMTPRQYLDTLLAVVRSRGTRVAAGKRLHDRIRANMSTREPSGVSGRGGVHPKSKVRPDMSLSEAFDVAARELDEEGLG